MALAPSSPEYRRAHRRYLKSTKNRDANVEKDWTPFRAAEKRFKARFPPSDLSDVLDLAMLDVDRAEEIQNGLWHGSSDSVEVKQISGPSGKKAFVVPRIPGLVLLPSFLSHASQRELVQWALRDHAKPPNPTNLDIHYHLPPEGLWNSYTSLDAAQTIIQPRKSEGPTESEHEARRQLVDNTPASPENFKALLETPKHDATPSSSLPPSTPAQLIRKMRWANIGWFYHWGTKQYDFAKGKSPIHEGIRTLCRNVITSIDWAEVYSAEDLADWGDAGAEWKAWRETYEPDAGIVNYYQLKDTLMAHVDRSEVNATSPLVSISLGHAAVFLIGGKTRDTAPIPVLLRSGDIVIMSGPACRRAYHGVPRILEDTLPPHLQKDGSDWDAFAEYLQTSRINVNVRQVFPKGFDPGIQI